MWFSPEIGGDDPSSADVEVVWYPAAIQKSLRIPVSDAQKPRCLVFYVLKRISWDFLVLAIHMTRGRKHIRNLEL
jgi:hypothetical protein